MNMTDRFTDTVQDYLKYRPSYPKKILKVLIDQCDFTKNKMIADIGSGTGLLTKLFLDYGNIVYGVEPNQAMREAAESYLRAFPNFFSIRGAAEETGLAAESVDFVTAGTAFHWFDVAKAKKEFIRILKTPGWAVLIWNIRDVDSSPLVKNYENLIRKFCKNYIFPQAKKFDQILNKNFFSPFEMKIISLRNSQRFNWEGLQGRLLSSSYSLRPGEEGYNEMMSELKDIFSYHQINGYVEFVYLTKMYYGRLR